VVLTEDEVTASAKELLERAHKVLADDDFGRKGEPAFFDLVEQAAKLGDGEAMMELAVCYQEGTGVKRQPKLAFHWMEKAALAGSEGARLVRVHGVESGSPRSVKGIDSGDRA
jgi:TPR repeat protein